jgi:hypothetical protein
MGRFTSGRVGQVQFHITKELGVFLATLETPRQDQDHKILPYVDKNRGMKITREVTQCLMEKAFS